MPKTYYDSELTGAQIEKALEAIHGVVTPSNNGKVLCIDNGAIAAKSASEWGHGAVLEPLSVTANGDYTPPTGTDGFDEVHVAVPSYPEPSGTIQITQNGTVNVKDYASAEVNVSGGGSAVVQPLSVTENGTYNPPSGVDGYAPVTVNVSGGGGGIIVQPNLPDEYQKLEYLINDTNKTAAIISLNLAIGDIIAFKVREAAEASGVGPVIGQQNWNVNVGAGSITTYGGYRQEKNDWSQEDGIYTLNSRILFTSAYSGNFWYGAWRGGQYQIVANSRLYPLYVLEPDKSSVYSTELKLKAALIPCYRVSDGANSFFDTISNTFLSVSGSFSRGPEVN